MVHGMDLTRRARRLLLWLVTVAAVLGLVHHVMWRDRTWFLELPANTWRWFDLNYETSIGTWFSVSLLLLIGAASFVAWAAEAPGRRRIAWLSIAIGALLLSLDDKISIHERLPEFFGIAHQSLATHEWLLPGAIIGGVAAVILIWLASSLQPAPRRGLLLGLVFFALGAVVIEGVSGYIIRTAPQTDALHRAVPTFVLVEEMLECLGAIIALVAVVSHLERSGVLALPERRSRRSRTGREVEAAPVE